MNSPRTFISRSICLLGCGIFCSSLLSAQVLVPEENQVQFENKTYSGISVMLKAKPEDVKDELEDWAEDTYDVDFDYVGGLIGRNDEVLVADNENIPMISNKAITLRAEVLPVDGGSKLTMFGSYGDDMAIEPRGLYAMEYGKIQEFTQAFLEDFVPEYYRERIEKAEANVEELQDDIDDFKEEMQDNKEKIDKLQRENRELENNIATAERKLSSAKQNVNTRQMQRDKAVDKVDNR